MILCAVRGHLRYSLSFRDVEELLNERGRKAGHTTIWRWVQRYEKWTPIVGQRGSHSKVDSAVHYAAEGTSVIPS